MSTVKRNRSIVMRESELKRLKKDITKEVTETAVLMLLAWLVDDGLIDNDPETVVAEYERFESWCSAMDEHLIKLRDIRRIVEDKMGGKVRVLK